MGFDHAVLVQQRKLAVAFQNTLNHKHHVRPAGVKLVKDQRHRALQRPRDNTFLKFGHLQPVPNHNGVSAHQIKAADMAVEIDPDAGPIQPRRDLLDMGGLTRSMKPLNHHPPIIAKTRENGQGHVMVKTISRINLRHMLIPFAKRRDAQVAVDAK